MVSIIGVFSARPTHAESFISSPCRFLILQCASPVPPTPLPEEDPVQNEEPVQEENPDAGEENEPQPEPAPGVTVTPRSETVMGGTKSVFTALIQIEGQRPVLYEVAIADSEGVVIFTKTYEVSEAEAEAIFAWDAVNLPSGIYTITVGARDAQEQSGQAAPLFVTVDNDGPAATVTGGNIIINKGSLSPKVVLDNSDDVASSLWVASEFNARSVFDPVVLQPFFTPSLEGTYIYYLTLTDALGNTSVLTFTFDYDEVLEPIIAPITPIDITPNPGAITPVTRIATVDPDLQKQARAEEEANTNSVLGATTAATAAPPVDIAPVASTKSGWSILGILWYWWLVVIALLGMIALSVRRHLLKKRIAFNS